MIENEWHDDKRRARMLFDVLIWGLLTAFLALTIIAVNVALTGAPPRYIRGVNANLFEQLLASLVIPGLVAGFLCGIFTAQRNWVYQRWFPYQPKHRCKGCGYARRGGAGAPCPDCGRVQGA